MSAREVELTDGAPWGFRMHGGVDQNQPLRISRVNPGRKASLSGIREGDVITSINGRTTKEMSNADAHAMLRSAGPVLRLGLNEDREMSPRRRSIGKATELKRPFQLIEINEKATPHPPVYATIRPPNSPNKLPSKPLSSHPTLNSTHLVKSFEDTPKFHPTNPFYSTLPNTKLPIPNGKSNSLQRSVHRADSCNDDLKLSSFFRKNDSALSIPNIKYTTSDASPKRFINDRYNSHSDKESNNDHKTKKNPFDNITNDFNNPDKANSSNGAKSMIYSKSDNNFHRNEEIIKHSSIIEQISETEEIKTIKKLTLNGSNETNGLKTDNKLFKFHSDHNINEHIIPTTLENEESVNHKNKKNGQEISSPSYQIPRGEYKVGDTQSTTPAQSPSQVTAQGNIRKAEDSGSCSNENRDIPDGSVVQNKIDNSDLPEKDDSLGSQTQETIVEQFNKSEVSECITKVNKEEIDVSEKYIVETPEQTSKPKAKLDNAKKSKSCDDDDSPKIVEVTEEYPTQSDYSNTSIIDSNKVIITTEEPEVEWEKTEEFNLPETEITKGILSNNHTISLDVAHCDQNKSLSPEEETSLRNYLHTLNLSTNPNVDTADIKTEIEQIINREIKYRLRRKGLAEETFFERSGPSRSLAVIDEEGSGDSSKTSRRQSYLSDKKSDTDELEDDVFESKDTQAKRRRDTNFPTNLSMRRVIPQQCIRVDAKLKEPEVSEARGDWKMETVEKITGAELVYLTDSSSSTSSIYDVSDDGEKGHETDSSVRIITPTIEVTDTESLLKNTFLTKNNDKNIIQTNETNIHIINEAEESKSEQNNNLLIDTDSITEIDNNFKKDPHEIIVLSTDDIKTSLFVKDINEINDCSSTNISGTMNSNNKNNITPNTKSPEDINNYDLEIKVLKCELNDAINNLIKEVVSDAENTGDSNSTQDTTVIRQDSSSSLDSSQCTAKYNPTYSSLNDVSSFLRNESQEDLDTETLVSKTSSHVKDVIEHVDNNIESKLLAAIIISQPSTLRNICLKKISSLPYGEKVLEELANVSKRLQDISVSALNYSKIDILQLNNHKKDDITENQKSSNSLNNRKENKHIPPPVKPRKSSLKKGQDEQRLPVPSKPEKVYECLSPSQKMLMEKTNTVIKKDDIIPIFKTHIENKTINKENDSSVLPMKSETGSRLLALLRNPSSPRKSSLPTLSDENYFPNSKMTSSRTESFSKRLLKEIDESNNFKDTLNNNNYTPTASHFKPIPPPKPRKVYTYESDSEFTDSSYRSIRSDKKVFHYSTGNLNEEIENDISSIQNMHRQCTNLRNKNSNIVYPRRPSLPKDLCDQQMEYIRQKEKEVEAEIRRLEQEQHKTSQKRGPRAPMISDKDSSYGGFFETKNLRDNVSNYPNSTNMENRKISSQFSSSQEELLREKMYTEYVNQMAEREQRKHNKVIKVTQSASSSNLISKSMPTLNYLDSKVNNRIEQEFISKAKERWYKLGIRDTETEDEEESGRDVYREPKVIEHKIKVIEGGEEKDVKKLPSHMQEFVRFTVKDKDEDTSSNETVMIAPTFKARSSSPAIWRPGLVTEGPPVSAGPPPPPPPPVWSPSATPQTPRKFRPVHFEDTPPERRKFGSSDQNGCTSGSESEGRLRTSLSAPASGLNSLSTSRLPRAQNPTVTLLQKAREGQLQRGRNSQLESDPRLPRDRPSPPRGDPVHALRKEYASESEAERSDYERGGRKMSEAKKIEGIGPITKDGMPVALRSEVKDPSRWYKKMYDTIHKNKYDEDYVTIRYKNSRGETLQRPSSNRSQYAYFDPRSGYLSEPEGGRDLTTPRRRTASVQGEHDKYSTLASSRVRHEVYNNRPGRIEDYVPGKSSVIDKEAKQWWDEVMDIFDGQNESIAPSQTQQSPKEKKDITSAILSKSNMARALKESGYESDSPLVFRRGSAAPLSPAERRAAYRDLQAGGEPPRGGFRSPAPHRHDESEIEYIPISSTLTKIRIHKKAPQMHEVICYPVTSIDKQYLETERSLDRKSLEAECVPIPPARISSRNSRTLKMVTSTRQASTCPKMEQSNVEFLKDKISNKLNRQHTHTIIKRKPVSQNTQSRVMSTSAPPALNRNKSLYGTKNTAAASKNSGTSSFSSPRRTILPVNYPDSRPKCGESSSSTIIEGGAGRRTPITNILDKVTALDKLWGSQKRNERIDVSKIKPKSIIKTPSKQFAIQKTVFVPKLEPTATHKSRDMIRTSEKVQKMKIQAKSTPCLAKQYTKAVKLNTLQTMSSISKSSSNLTHLPKKQNTVKIATVTNLKKKKPLENLSVKTRNTPPHEENIKKVRHCNSKKIQKGNKTPHKKQRGELHSDIETASEFGDNLDRISIKGSSEFLDMHISKDLKKARNAIVSNSFFQHLFLRDSMSLPVSTILDEGIPNTVLQKAKYFQTLPDTSLNYSNSINSYLVHRKPVSLSRFKMWDRQSSPLPIQNPRSISWPGKMDGHIRKFESLTKCTNEFGSSSSLSTIRSKSEPPSNKLYFSQTSRPVSPTVIFHKRQVSPIKKSPSPVRFLFPLPTRSMSPNVKNKTKKLESLSRSPPRIFFSNKKYSSSHSKLNDNLEKSLTSELRENDELNPGTIFFSETSRPVSPKVVHKAPLSRSQSTSPAPIRSPSYRRIHNARVQNKLETVKKEFRTRSADNVEKEKVEKIICCRPKSDSNLYENDPDYDEYINDIQNMTGRSVRFRELNRYYSYLERVAELEKATANQNTCYRKKDEEIIDFDRWKKIRTIERAEEELNNLYTKLKKAQNENDIFFYPRDVNDFRWNFNRERGLRMKEKSVEDLKEELEQKTSHDVELELDCSQSKDTYKPLWRGTSVAETAFTINKKNELDHKNPGKNKKTSQPNHLSDLRKKIGLGSRLWSSLSMDQVNALKNQLNAIYSKEFESKSNLENENFAITVENAKNVKQPSLHVRCSSLITPKNKSITPELNKSESIAAISFPVSSEKEIKNNVNKMQMSLTESEKKKISQSLSKELLNRMSNNNTPSSVLSVKSEIEKPIPKTEIPKKYDSKSSDVSIKLIAEMNESINEKKRHIIFPISQVETSNQSSASETETGSSDVSGKTVIFKGPSVKEVQKKVQYFESVRDEKEPPTTIYHPKEDSIEKKVEKTQEKTPDIKNTKTDNNQIFQSQSCSNLKELFGESEKNKYLSLPSKADLYSRSPSPQSEVYVSDRRTPDTLRFSSDETIWRSRTPSPDPERYWRAYLKLAREGEVRRLARRFDSPSAAGAVLRRYRSDPEIIRNDINNSWLTDRFFKRGKCRSLLPVARMPLRPSNRFMPHIDVISKLAALRKRNTPRSRSAEEVLECRPGEVERIRRRFEAMSLLGQIYTSAPDVCELQNITSYLAGPWIAHRYPKPEDNKKNIPDANTLRGRTSIKKDKTKSKEPVNLSSILKTDSLAKQAFNPLAHQPTSRYEPPRTPPRPPPATLSYRLAPYVTPLRHTVTFQESDSAPEPPRRASHGSYSDSESPNRRYVESDVNIHYRCPVRHDPLPLVPERELALQQADHMKRLYREQRRNKYLQELQDMQNRRHQDNFMPSQKAIVPLNRYDEAERIVAKALYTFNGQTTRELSFRKGDIINVRRQIDSNWYEGEVHGKVGLFPYNYVELMKGDGVQTLKKTSIIEGRARAKFDFIAQTNLELPLKKGEVVVLTRRIDHNWWEGRTGNKTGIFPDSYVTILQEPSQGRQEPPASRPQASPASLAAPAHRYTPQHNSPALSNAPPATAPLPTNGSGRRPRGAADLNNTEPLYVDTNAEAVPYRAMYKYRPQNPDELELCEGDTVYVLEKCDDGWYVGSSQRSGRFGTFPGNYVERI